MNVDSSYDLSNIRKNCFKCGKPVIMDSDSKICWFQCSSPECDNTRYVLSGIKQKEAVDKLMTESCKEYFKDLKNSDCGEWEAK